ncbi:hypothetical protein [Bartonella grahamii]|uniref:hypothetical protein n=1 Tax=Bartonella grahamii TaxID=33045 RepID=UPI002E7BDF67|nr:hypothetical protein [Bartonella grahamii]
MKKLNAPLPTLSELHAKPILANCFLKSRSHILSETKSLIRFSSFHAVQYTTEILLQKYANAFPIGFYKVKSLSMSKNQYKSGKVIGILQKMRSSFVIKKSDVYKPCLLILYVNGTNLAVISNRDFRVFGLSPKYPPSTHIKSLLAMYFKCYKFYSKHIAIHIYKWALKNLGVIKSLIDIDFKARILQKIDKTMRFVYMAILSDDSGVILKKATWKTATRRN